MYLWFIGLSLLTMQGVVAGLVVLLHPLHLRLKFDIWLEKCIKLNTYNFYFQLNITEWYVNNKKINKIYKLYIILL